MPQPVRIKIVSGAQNPRVMFRIKIGRIGKGQITIRINFGLPLV